MYAERFKLTPLALASASAISTHDQAVLSASSSGGGDRNIAIGGDGGGDKGNVAGR